MLSSASQPPPWYRRRRYLHFDRPIGEKKATRIVKLPDCVTKHSFYPLIKYQLVSKKIRKTEDGKIEFKEKTRDISYAAHVDAHVYSFYAKTLDEHYENFLSVNDLSSCVLAFRSLGKSNIEFAKDAFDEIASRPQCAAVALDVSGFFDNLDHEIIKRQWCKLLGLSSLPDDHYNIFKSLTKFSTVDRTKLYKLFGISPSNPKHERNRVCTPREFRLCVRATGLVETNPNKFGIPQGTPISSTLSNIYMMDFDLAMNHYAKNMGGVYLRYCDDILFIVPVHEMKKCEDIAAQGLVDLKLSINSGKTVRREFMRQSGVLRSVKPLQYLGFTFDGQQILIRSAAFARYSNRMKRGVRLAKATSRRWNRLRSERGAKEKDIYRRKLYRAYSHLGRRNFITYGYRAAKKMNSSAIRRQLKPLWHRLLNEIENAEK